MFSRKADLNLELANRPHLICSVAVRDNQGGHLDTSMPKQYS